METCTPYLFTLFKYWYCPLFLFIYLGASSISKHQPIFNTVTSFSFFGVGLEESILPCYCSSLLFILRMLSHAVPLCCYCVGLGGGLVWPCRLLGLFLGAAMRSWGPPLFPPLLTLSDVEDRVHTQLRIDVTLPAPTRTASLSVTSARRRCRFHLASYTR